MSRQLTKQEAHQQQLQQQQHQQQAQHARDVETHEHHASANASVSPTYHSSINRFYRGSFSYQSIILTFYEQAGLNLNLFGALSGAFSSKSKKTTHNNADGSSLSVEEKHDQGTFTPFAYIPPYIHPLILPLLPTFPPTDDPFHQCKFEKHICMWFVFVY